MCLQHLNEFKVLAFINENSLLLFNDMKIPSGYITEFPVGYAFGTLDPCAVSRELCRIEWGAIDLTKWIIDGFRGGCCSI